MTHIPGRSQQCLESVCGIGQTDISTIALSRTAVDQGPLSTILGFKKRRWVPVFQESLKVLIG
jgi:hypothetical protein